jgi:hypothetical protein
MRIQKFLVLCLLLFLPVLSQSEVLYLKDGSTIQGKLVRFVNDTLYFETSFGPEVRVPREKVMRIDFVESALQPGLMQTVPQQSSAPGTLMVSFEEFHLTSRVNVHRGKNREALTQANSIELALYVGSDKVHSEIDSVTDKEIREGPDTALRNDMSPTDFKVAVASGTYQCRVFFGNSMVGDYKDYFATGPHEKKLLVENVKILPAETTQLRIGMKRKMKFGAAQLYVFD